MKVAKAEAEALKKELVTKAEDDARHLLAEADKESKRKERQALESVTRQAIELSLIAAEQVLRDKVTAVNQDDLITRSLSEFDAVVAQRSS
jgi:F0F1-type ATP synthase membrane subunit b/b'